MCRVDVFQVPLEEVYQVLPTDTIRKQCLRGNRALSGTKIKVTLMQTFFAASAK